jgi:hypothetical protein
MEGSSEDVRRLIDDGLDLFRALLQVANCEEMVAVLRERGADAY